MINLDKERVITWNGCIEKVKITFIETGRKFNCIDILLLK